MTKRFLLAVIVVFLLPVSSEAAYRLYLKNGSVITGISSYEKKNGEMVITIGGGSLGFPMGEVLKIEETTAPEVNYRSPETAGKEVAPAPAPSAQDQQPESTERSDELKAQLDALNEEIKAVEEEEASVRQKINERKGMRLTYNSLQLKQLQRDLEPLDQELLSLSQRKGALLERKAALEREVR